MGTAFSVQFGQKAVEVLVTEGRVLVDQAATHTNPATRSLGPSASPSQAFVDAGNFAVVTTQGSATTMPVAQVLPISRGDASERLAWREPRLEFSGTPLAEVIRLFAQHSGVHFILAAPELGELKVSGVVRANNTEALLLLLKINFSISAEHQQVDRIVLSQGF